MSKKSKKDVLSQDVEETKEIVVENKPIVVDPELLKVEQPEKVVKEEPVEPQDEVLPEIPVEDSEKTELDRIAEALAEAKAEEVETEVQEELKNDVVNEGVTEGVNEGINDAVTDGANDGVADGVNDVVNDEEPKEFHFEFQKDYFFGTPSESADKQTVIDALPVEEPKPRTIESLSRDELRNFQRTGKMPK